MSFIFFHLISSIIFFFFSGSLWPFTTVITFQPNTSFRNLISKTLDLLLILLSLVSLFKENINYGLLSLGYLRMSSKRRNSKKFLCMTSAMSFWPSISREYQILPTLHALQKQPQLRKKKSNLFNRTICANNLNVTFYFNGVL